ncbi:DUF4326 domain-containing protein [Streptomyces jumonjinensis]|uniref:DUF4326 domain-containing protein n=1 Tax=Streptomyces jumonjinensis TaxID=1945 RepID=UPI003788E770
MPARIQRRRTAGWRAPEGAVYVGRSTRWGNPARVGWFVYDPATHRYGPAHHTETAAHADAVANFKAYLAARPELVAAVRQRLAGRDLMCWCPLPEPGQPDHCHAAVLLTLANPT